MTEKKQTCPSCSAAIEPGDQFCGECGTGIPDVDVRKNRKRGKTAFYILMGAGIFYVLLFGFTTFFGISIFRF